MLIADPIRFVPKHVPRLRFVVALPLAQRGQGPVVA